MQATEASPYRSILSFSRSSSHASTPQRVFAVKKSKNAYAGAKDRQRKLKEVETLKALGHSDHVLSFVDSWEDKGHLYIQTEFCEENTLDVFLATVGHDGRLDDFRIWKILLELTLGVEHIHDCGYIHLDLKPANILITFEGVLKIADFGMATKWPAGANIEGEGDRRYIGDEILVGKYDKPADIFALGLIMLEIAANIELPDNGASWQRLRNGDMSEVPSLTFSSDESDVPRDESGNRISEDASSRAIELQTRFRSSFYHDDSQEKSVQILARSGELLEPPKFMVDANSDQALDQLVQWMISPDPAHRPLAKDLHESYGVQWVEHRRRAGATIFEGNWGPADEVLAEDAEMIDV